MNSCQHEFIVISNLHKKCKFCGLIKENVRYLETSFRKLIVNK